MVWHDRPFPLWLRAYVRVRSIGLVGVAIVIGAVGAVLVTGLNATAQLAHEFLFGLRRGEHLSVASGLPWQRVLAVLTLGGGVLALASAWLGKNFTGRLADAIEANALHGGRMSVGGSAYIVLQTLISNGCGAAVGLEAAYTQTCAALASRIGRGLAARRSDIRLLVGCGAAGAIAAAFGAPLAGAFYGFEVVLGGYSVASLAPVVASAVTANLVVGALRGQGAVYVAIDASPLLGTTLTHALIIAAIAAVLGIVVMEGVAIVEGSLARLRVPPLLRPVLGGAAMAGLAMISPMVMGSGHGALQEIERQQMALGALALAVALKCAGSAISLGSGFRGGLFFASLLIGGALGRLYANALNTLTIFHIDPGTAAIAGLAAFGAGVLGAPITMTVLALEITGDFYATISALVAATVATTMVRELFGYSFATWRFHLRGENIRGAADIGWMRDLTVGALMRKATPTAPSDINIAQARALFPPGSEKQFFLVECDNRFAGVVLTGDLHAAEIPVEASVRSLALKHDCCVTPELGVRDALNAFEDNECDVLAVIDSPAARRVVGLLTEAHALRRYGEELERRHRAVIER